MRGYSGQRGLRRGYSGPCLWKELSDNRLIFAPLSLLFHKYIRFGSPRPPPCRAGFAPPHPPGGFASPRPPSRTSLLSTEHLKERGRVAPRAPPQADKGYRPRAPKARSPTGGHCPRNPRRALPSRPTGGPLPCHELKNSGRLLPKPPTNAQKPAVLTPTGRFCGPIWGAGPPSPPENPP